MITMLFGPHVGMMITMYYAVSHQIDLSSMISKNGCECLNEADDHPLAHALTSKGGYLQSDCDEQVTFHEAFSCLSMLLNVIDKSICEAESCLLI